MIRRSLTCKLKCTINNYQANLVSLHSEEEHQFVVGLNGGSGIHWLGGRRDPGNRDTWVWSDGTPWDYSNWARGQPADFAGKEDCAHIWDVNQKNTVYGLWNDAPCSSVTTFVCKKVCQAGWSAFNGKCYKSFSEEKTWDEAEDQCVKEHANLVSIHSEEEHQFVVGLNGGFPWLGGRRDPENLSNFVWSDGTPWDYSNWASGQPSDDRGDEDCAHMWEWEYRLNEWNDRPCSHERTFVCKKGL